MEKRNCRVCGVSYQYPVPKSIATRFYCDQCVQIPGEIRRVLELMRRKMDRMESKIDKLERERTSAEG